MIQSEARTPHAARDEIVARLRTKETHYRKLAASGKGARAKEVADANCMEWHHIANWCANLEYPLASGDESAVQRALKIHNSVLADLYHAVFEFLGSVNERTCRRLNEQLDAAKSLLDHDV